MQPFLHSGGGGFVLAGGHQGGGNVARYFRRERWARQRDDIGFRRGLVENAAHREAGGVLDAFGDGDDDAIKSIEPSGHRAKGCGRHGDNHGLGFVECLFPIGFQPPRIGQFDAGKIFGVFLFVRHGREAFGMAPESELVPGFVGDLGQRSAPRACAEHGDSHGVAGFG